MSSTIRDAIPGPQSFRGSRDLLRSWMLGAAAFLLGLVITTVSFVIKRHRQSDVLQSPFDWTPLVDQTLQVGLASYWELHFAWSPSMGERLITHPRGPAYYAGTPDAMLLLVPIVILVAAGAIAASSGRSPDGSNRWVTGATIVTGYLTLTLLGLVALHLDLGGQTSSGAPLGTPDLSSVLIIGVLYPLVLGTVGGLITEYVST